MTARSRVRNYLAALRPCCFIGLRTANVQPAIEAQARQYGVCFYKKPVTEAVIATLVADIEQRLGN